MGNTGSPVCGALPSAALPPSSSSGCSFVLVQPHLLCVRGAASPSAPVCASDSAAEGSIPLVNQPTLRAARGREQTNILSLSQHIAAPQGPHPPHAPPLRSYAHGHGDKYGWNISPLFSRHDFIYVSQQVSSGQPAPLLLLFLCLHLPSLSPGEVLRSQESRTL